MTLGVVPAFGAAPLIALTGMISSRCRRTWCHVEVCFMNHLAPTHAKAAASYKPLTHARWGLLFLAGI